MNFDESKEFSKEFKTLLKKWRTLEKDLISAKVFIEGLYRDEKFHELFFSGKKGTILIQDDKAEVVKMRLDCSSPGAKGKARIVFIFVKEAEKITLVELYSKNDKDREDLKRIKKYAPN